MCKLASGVLLLGCQLQKDCHTWACYVWAGSCGLKQSLYVVTFSRLNLSSKSIFLASEAPSCLINFSFMFTNNFLMPSRVKIWQKFGYKVEQSDCFCPCVCNLILFVKLTLTLFSERFSKCNSNEMFYLAYLLIENQHKTLILVTRRM